MVRGRPSLEIPGLPPVTTRPAGAAPRRGSASGVNRASAVLDLQAPIFEGTVHRQGSPSSGFHAGSRVFHNKFGPGAVIAVDGSKLTVDFDKAGRKLVMDSFVAAEG